ncbi:serine/threonine-protein kinase [Microseira wollei]|uniref:Serine/Threonine protein kinase with WD40 repeats n=1 Tax=Microseira wollei NIES-4236 TaxID=2530354 RepID=A0AAV3XA79_9CYAN|nr:serine/threonine-protein kinase [Microseira wollei]GET38293.1 serine/Threonine protein kinase with WD40 repeats [Microseira wollei NIES-4236]
MLLLHRYRIIELIAQGGFSKTFLAVDEFQSPALSCVVKEFWIQNQEKTITILEREAGKLKELGKHPQIPALLDFFESDGFFYWVQELIDGMNLAKVIELEGVFNESQVWDLLNNLLPVLKFIHERDVIHGDIKPANIIRVENKAPPWGIRSPGLPPGNDKVGLFVLVGFGNSMGSAEYVAPEQLGGKAVFASDLYSLGVSCVYLLTGVSPFNLSPGIWREYLQEKISDRFSHLLDKLLQNDPKQRFQSADEVMRIMGKKSQILNLKSHISNSPCLQTLTGHGGLFSGVNSVAISPDNQILASGSDDKTVRLWNVETGEAIATLFGHTNFVQSVAFSPDGTILASGSDDKMIKLWDLQTYEEICTLSEHSRPVKSVKFSPRGEGRILASGSWDKTIKLWDLEAKKAICTITGHQLQVTCVTFSPDGRYLASASFDRTVRLWDWQNWELLTHQILSGHSWPVFSVAFSPKGDILATGSGDNTIKLWDLKTGQEIRTILGHSWSVVAVAFSPDGETLISGSWDKTVKLWQVSTGKEIDTLAGHLDAVSTVAVSPNGQIIASGSKDKTIKLWRRDA